MKLNNKQKLSIFPAIFIALGIVFLPMTCSCSRSVTKSAMEVKKNETVKSTEVGSNKTETNVKVETNKVVDTNTNTVTETIKVTPIDNSKPATFKDKNGKIVELVNSIYENRIKTDLSHKKEQLSNVSVIDKKKLKTAKKEVLANKSVDVKQSNKQTERKSFNWWWLLLLLVPIWIYRKEIIKKLLLWE